MIVGRGGCGSRVKGLWVEGRGLWVEGGRGGYEGNRQYVMIGILENFSLC